ncbi:helicase C-terminal domain-containing protein [Chryseomicrobium palamuruense]|uniref:3'-5' exonuclease DinG n=1 Tax=Chryseomicrobium palamuruense TaxID=682973 RepID=A0ABV8UTX7_9BACL
MNDKYAVVDIETTGSSPKNGDRIIQIGIARIENGEVVSTYSSFVNPEKKIPPFIQELTGISNDHVQNAPLFAEIAEDIYRELEGTVFVAHNVNFDFPFLQGELKRLQLPLLKNKKADTVEFARLMFPTALSYKLSEITLELGIELSHAHRADADAYATAELFLACCRKLETLSQVTIKQLHKRCFRLKSHLAPLFFEALKKADRLVTTTNPTEEVVTSAEFPSYPETIEEKVTLLREVYSTVEQRPSQFDYMDTVKQALDTRSEIALEAETGIGKTIGYLVPSLAHTQSTGKKIIISTYTNTLMDQLVEGELAKLQSVYLHSFTVAKLKSFTHYLDRGLLAMRLDSPDESYDESFSLMQVLVWLTETKTGDLSELNTTGAGQLTLDKLRKQRRTPGIQGDFYEQIVEKAKQASIIVTNHAMLVHHPESLQFIQSDVDALIVDEAHHFLTAVQSASEKAISFTDWKYLFSQFGFHEATQVGFKLAQILGSNKDLLRIAQRLELVNHLFDELISQLSNTVGKTKSSYGSSKVTVPLSGTQNLFVDFSKEVNEVVQKFEELLYRYPVDNVIVREEVNYWIRELRTVAYDWEEFMTHLESQASWLDADKRSIPSSFIFRQRQLDWKEEIERSLTPYRGKSSIIWTSGTLTVPNHPWFILDQLHLPKDTPLRKFYAQESFYSGARVFVVNDVPDVTQVDQTTFIESIADVIIQTVQASQGRTFVLFTSQDMLRKTVELIEDSGLLEDYLFIAQGMNAGSKMRMLRTFQRFQKAILFGTTTFWEGVDVPGEALSTIIMVRLPFTNPDDPYFKQKAARLTAEGENPFSKLSLPEAIIRFRQGFGRLIRNSEEKGAFIILDRRIQTKSYGREFLVAIPNVPKEELSTQSMVETLESWYNS